jgi:hypothetical protein
MEQLFFHHEPGKFRGQSVICHLLCVIRAKREAP